MKRIRDRLVLFRRLVAGGVSAAGARWFGRGRPILIGWAVTHRCNLHCAYCARPQAAATHAELDREAALSLADDIARSGAVVVTLTGGEPLLRPDIGDIVRRLRSEGVLVGVNTNGVLLPERVDAIADASFVSVSVDGPEEIHDRLRGQGAFRKAVDGIRACSERGLPVTAHAVLTALNTDGLDFFLAFASEHGTPFTFSPVDSFPLTSAGVPDLLPDVDRYRAFLDRAIRERARDDSRIADSVACLQYLRNWPEYRPIRCSAGRVFCRIEPDGSLHACGALVGKTPPGDLSRGLLRAFDRLPPAGCRSCWCDSEVEMNLLYSLHPEAVVNAAGMLLRRAVGSAPKKRRA